MLEIILWLIVSLIAFFLGFQTGKLDERKNIDLSAKKAVDDYFDAQRRKDD